LQETPEIFEQEKEEKIERGTTTGWRWIRQSESKKKSKIDGDEAAK
jgi:hypothetical protein